MNKRNAAWLLVGTFVISNYSFSNQALAASPEEQCFTHLANAAKRNSAFNNLDLSRVQKVSGENRQLKSERFSVETHNDFLDVFRKPVPYFQSDLEYYPNEMNEVSSQHRFTPKIHKANRNNSAVIIYNDGSSTPIDHWMSDDGSSAAGDIKKYFTGQKTANWIDNKHVRQTIDGYYLDSKYVTFGRESDLDFSFPSRAANPEKDDYYPSGRPVMDMREYLIFTHHLNSAAGGDFLSCSLVKVVPQSPFTLKDYTYSGKSIAWENYGGTQMSASNVTTHRINNQFRKAEIEYTINTRQDPDNKLLRFYALSVNYNNGSDFLNTFRTVEMFNEAMLDASNANQTFLEMRRAYYDKIRASGLLIGGGAVEIEIDGDSTVNPAPNANWVRCAEENQTCSFSGTSDIRYGLNGSFYYKEATDSIECSNDEFGDPLVGTRKTCWYDSNQASGPSFFNGLFSRWFGSGSRR